MADKSKKQQYLDAIKSMTPGAVLEFVSKQLEMNPVKFLATNAGWLALAAAKNGWVKATEIKDAIKDFSNKNKEDNTGIDFQNVEVDEDTMKFMCLLDGDAMKKLDEFVKNYYDDLKDFGKECEEADDKLRKDAKAKDIDLSKEEIDKHGMTVAGVIDDKDNSKASGKELTDEIKQRIELQKEIDELEKKRAALAGKLKAIDTSDAKDNKKTKNESMYKAYRRGKLIAEAAALEFSCGGHSSMVDDQAIKNAAYAIGKTVKNKEEAIAKFTEWLKDTAANRGPNGAFSALDSKDIERTLTNGNTVLKGLQDYAAKVFDNPDAISNQVSQKIIDSAADGSVDPSEFGVKFVAPSDASFEKLIHAMNDLDSKDPKKIEAAAATIKKFRSFASNFPKDDPFYLNACKGAEAMYAAKTGNVLDGSTAPKDLIEKAKNFKGGLHKFTDNMEKGFDADGIEERAKAATDAKETVKAAAGQAADADDYQVDYKAGPGGNPFNASIMEKRLDKIEDIFDDKKLTVAEYKEFQKFSRDMMSYEKWAIANANSDDPQVLARIKQIQRMSAKLNEFENEHLNDLNKAADARLGKLKNPNKFINTDQSTTSQDTQEEVKKKTGMKMFTGLGLARLAARTTGYVLNHGKDLVNALGARSIKKKEDKGVIAEVTVLLTNGKDSDTKFSDTKFSVRFNVYDMKWHATNLDDRKMKFPEETVIKKVLDTNTGKKFKEACLKKWSNVFDPEDKSKKIVADILSNPKKTQLKLDGNTAEFIDMVSEIGKNFDEVKTQFK